MDDNNKQGEFLTHLLNGNNAVIKNDMETAVAEYELALRFNADFFLTYTKLGHVYYKTEKYDKAIECFRKSLDMNPEQTATLYQLGKAYHKVGMNVQAAVAYDMAMEKDRGGDYTSAIETRKRRIRQHSSGRSLNELRGGNVISKSISMILSTPGLMFPYLIAAAVLYCVHTVTIFMLHKYFGNSFEIVTVSRILFQTPSETNFPVFIYYCIITAMISFFCVPLYTASMMDANRIYRKQKPLKGESVTASFSQLSPLASLAFLLIIASIMLVSASIFMLDVIEKSMMEFFGITLLLHPLAIFCIPWLASFAAFSFPCIAIEKHQMESGVRKGLRFGRKYANIIMAFFSLYTLIHLVLARFIPDITLSGFVVPKALLTLLAVTPFQAIVLVGIALIYTMGQEVKKKSSGSSRRKSRRQSPEEFEEPEFDFEQEIEDILEED